MEYLKKAEQNVKKRLHLNKDKEKDLTHQISSKFDNKDKTIDKKPIDKKDIYKEHSSESQSSILKDSSVKSSIDSPVKSCMLKDSSVKSFMVKDSPVKSGILKDSSVNNENEILEEINKEREEIKKELKEIKEKKEELKEIKKELSVKEGIKKEREEVKGEFKNMKEELSESEEFIAEIPEKIAQKSENISSPNDNVTKHTFSFKLNKIIDENCDKETEKSTEMDSERFIKGVTEINRKGDRNITEKLAEITEKMPIPKSETELQSLKTEMIPKTDSETEKSKKSSLETENGSQKSEKSELGSQKSSKITAKAETTNKTDSKTENSKKSSLEAENGSQKSEKSELGSQKSSVETEKSESTTESSSLKTASLSQISEPIDPNKKPKFKKPRGGERSEIRDGHDSDSSVSSRKKTKKTRIKSKFAPGSIEYYEERLRGRVFSGWVDERRWVDEVAGYRDVIEVDEWEVEMNRQLNAIVGSVPGVSDGKKWINITPPSDTPNYCLWVLLAAPPRPGHYWFSINAIHVQPQFGLRIGIKEIREIHPHDGETAEARRKRQKKREGQSELDSLGDQVQQWLDEIKEMKWSSVWTVISSTVTVSNIRETVRFLIVLIMTMVLGLVTLVRESHHIGLRFMREGGIFLRNITPFLQSILAFVEKLIGGFYLLIAMVYRDFRRPGPTYQPSHQPSHQPSLPPAYTPGPSQGTPFAHQPRQIKYVPPERWVYRSENNEPPPS